MAKIYMALLGTSQYEEMTYCYNGLECKTCYIQEALLEMLLKQGDKFDRIVFFLTAEARAKHWKVLCERILRLYPEKGVIREIGIDYNESRAGLLNLFHTMYDAMGKGDCVTFDITHSFRSIPALFFPLMSYAKEMKQITVDHIFYGPFDNVTKCPKVIDLKIYERIMTCSGAAHSFIRTGNAAEILETVSDQKDSMPATERKAFSKTQSAAKYLSELSAHLLLCLSGNHGKYCISDSAKRVRNTVESLREEQQERQSREMSSYEKEAAFFDELIDHVYDSVREVAAEQSLFKEGMAAVQWYISKGHVMQGYSALRETIITFLCETYAPGEDCQNIKLRGAVENALNALNEKSKGRAAKQNVSAFYPAEERYLLLFMKTYSHIEPQAVTFVKELLNRRNMMDHFGMNKDYNSEPNMVFLKECYQKAQILFDDITQRRDEILTDEEAQKQIQAAQTGVFVNFSNHPSESWDAAQKDAAAAICGTDRIIDVPFPRVLPELNEDEIRQLAQDCVQQIEAKKPAAVMCMGEFGLCYQVVSELKKRRIPVVYSCSERESQERISERGEVEKISVFRFRGFRHY